MIALCARVALCLVVINTLAAGVCAQVTGRLSSTTPMSGGLSSSAPMSGQLCRQPAANGASDFLYPAKPLSIDWRGQTYSLTGSVWKNETPEHSKAVASALVAAREPNAPPLDLGWGGITDVKPLSLGVLVTTDAGEWGGAVWFVQTGRSPLKIVDKNAVGLFNLGGTTIALTGLAHMSLDRGELFRLDLSGAVPSAVSLAKLPGAPRAWTMAGDSALLIATGDKGFAILNDGRMEAATVRRECVGPDDLAR